MATHPYNIQLNDVQDALLEERAGPTDKKDYLQLIIDSMIDGWQRDVWSRDIKSIGDRWDDISQEVRDQVKTLMGI